ncbi:MAG: hypothetical protein ABMB14_18610, partial [Myxococcota bacterium]
MNYGYWLTLLTITACTGGVAPSDSNPQDPTGSNPPTNTVVDSDGDGLTDLDEIDLGTDPQSVDSDEDRADDKAEVDAGTDPLAPDSDGDGYADGDELIEGSDPLDASSGIYLGGWPYNPFKDDLGNPGFSGSISIGGLYPDLVGVDQFGQEVHLYDLAGGGVPVVVDFSTVWCPPCNDWADYLAGIETVNNAWVNAPNIRAAVESGEVRWVTVLLENISGGEPTDQDAVSWSEVHPDDRIPVLIPGNPSAPVHFGGINFYPTMMVLDDDMTVQDYDYFCLLYT